MATRFPRSWFWSVMMLSLAYGLAVLVYSMHVAHKQALSNSLERQVSDFLKLSAIGGPLITAPRLFELNGELRPGGRQGDLLWLMDNAPSGARQVPEDQRREKTALIISQRDTVLSFCSVSEGGAVTIRPDAREQLVKAVTVARFQDSSWKEYMDWTLATISALSAFVGLAILLLSNLWAFIHPHVGWRRLAVWVGVRHGGVSWLVVKSGST